MNQIILISQDEALRKSLDEECLTLRECHFFAYDSVEAFLPEMNIITGHELFIVDSGTVKDISLVSREMRNRKERFSRYIYYRGTGDLRGTDFISVPNRIELSFHLKQAEFLHMNSDRFMGIAIDSLTHFESLPFPLYLSLSSEKFVKRIPAYEPFDFRMLLGYKARGVKEFYFERIFAKDFTALLMEKMTNKIERPFSDRTERDLASGEVYATVREIISLVGLKPKVIEICHKLIEELTASINAVTEDDLSLYLRRLRTRPELNFHYRLTELTAFLSGEVIETKEPPLRDLIFAAFFCDMSLKFPDHIHLRKSSELLGLENDVIDAVSGHAAASAEMVVFKDLCSKDAFRVILQHHGAEDGIGFPDVPDKGIDEASKAFIVAHELAYGLLSQPEASVWAICQELIKRFKDTCLEDIVLRFEVNLLKDRRWGSDQ